MRATKIEETDVIFTAENNDFLRKLFFTLTWTTLMYTLFL